MLKDYTDAVFEEGKQFNYDSNMGIYLRPAPKLNPLAGVLCVNRVDDSGSYLDGNDDLDSGDGRLVGVAPEAHGGKTSCAKRTVQKQAPTLDLVLRTIERFTAPAVRKDIEEALRNYYKRSYF